MARKPKNPAGRTTANRKAGAKGPPPPRRRTLFVVAVFVVIAIGYFQSISGSWHIHSDSAMYVGLARSLSQGKGYAFNHARHVKYPPVFPIMLLPVIPLQKHDVWGMQALGALCGIGTLALAYVLVKARAGMWGALAVVTMTAMCTWFQLHAVGYVLSGVPYALWASLAIVYAERQVQADRFVAWKWALVGFLATVAIYTHLSGVSLLVAIAAGAVFARGQRWRIRQRLAAAGLVLVIGGVATGCWTLRSLTGAKKPGYDAHVVREPLVVLGDPLPKLTMRMAEWGATPLGLEAEEVVPTVGIALCVLLIVPGVARGFRKYRSVPEFYILSYFLVLLFYGGRGSRERYVVPALPMIFYYIYETARLLGRALMRLGERLLGDRLAKRRQAISSAALGLAVLAVCSAGIYQRLSGRGATWTLSQEWTRRRQAYLRHWEEISRRLDRLVPGDAVLFAGCGGEEALVHYFTGRHVGYYPGRERGIQILRRMVDQQAAFVIVEKRKPTYLTMRYAIKTYPDCFELVYDGPNDQLHRVVMDEVRQVVGKADGHAGEP